MASYPPYFIVQALLLSVSCRAVWVQLPCREVFVQNLKFGIALEYARVNRWKHRGNCVLQKCNA